MKYAPLFLLICSLTQMGAAKEEWEHLENCQLVPSFLNDGDSFLVRHGNKESVFRLYFVDAPEVASIYPDRVKKQTKYFSTTEKRTLEVGSHATKFAAQFMSGRFSVYTKWQDALGRATRYAAFIVKDNTTLAEALVENGLVRIYGFKTANWEGRSATSFEAKLKIAERKAKEAKLGGWGMVDQPLPPKPQLPDEPNEPLNQPAIPVEDRINLNLATAEELEQLPSVGSTIAVRIVDGRPWRDIESIRKVKGIGDSAMVKLKPLVTVLNTDAPHGTADYFRMRTHRWMNRQVEVSVEMVEDQNWPAPDGFVVLLAHTGKLGIPGGSIPIFFPEERLESVLRYYGEGATRGVTKALFCQYNGEDVLVIQRPPDPKQQEPDSL